MTYYIALSSLISLLDQFPVYNLGKFSIKLSHFSLILFAIGLIFTKRLIINLKIFVSCLIIIFLLLISIYFSPVKISSSYSLILTFLFNIFISWIYISIVYNFSLTEFEKLLLYNINIQIIISLIQLVLLILGYNTFIDIGKAGFGGIGRMGGIFVDSNWLAAWIVMNFALYSFLKEKRGAQVNLFYLFLIFIILIFIQSRIGLICFFGTIILIIEKSNLKKIMYLSVLIMLILLGINKSILPYNFLYDLVDLNSNPRLNDMKIFIDVINIYNRKFIGMGFGTLNIINDYYPWRELTSVSNNLLGQIFFEFGIIGVSVFILGIIFLFKKINNKIIKLIILMLLLINLFHNSLFKQYFWLIIGNIYIISLKLDSISLNIKK